MKKSNFIKTLFATLFMLGILSVALTFNTKSYAATATIVMENNTITSKSLPGTAHAIKLIQNYTIPNSSTTLTAGDFYYFFDSNGKLANLASDSIVPVFTGIGTTAYANKALGAGTINISANPASTIRLKSGMIGASIFYNGDLYNGYYLSGNKYYTVASGKRGALKTGVATGTFFNGSSFGSLGSGIYVNAGVKTTAVVNLRLYNKGNYDASTTDWMEIGNKVYYFKKGYAVTGWHHLPSYGRGIKNYTYLFNSSGVLNTNLVDYYGYKKFIAKKLFIIVNKRTHNTTFYIQDKNGNPTIPALTISCATAKKKGDTPNGTFRLEKTWNKRWYVYTKTQGAPYRYYQWAVKIHGTSSLFHSSTYRRKSAASLDVGRYNKLGTSCTTHCVRHQAKYAKLIYDIATYKLSVRKWRKTRVPVRIITSPNEGPFGHVNHPKRVKSSTKYDPTDPAKKK